MAGGSGGHEAISRARPWVDRASERAAIERALNDALAGRSRLVLVTGDPGIGKTCLADEASRRARDRGFRVLWARCWADAGAPSYWPWVQILREHLRSGDAVRLADRAPTGGAHLGSLVGELRERLLPSPGMVAGGEPGGARFFLFDSVSRLLATASKREPLLLAIDDLHWADPASLLLLRFLVRQAPGARILVIGTCRAPGPGAGPETARLLGELRRESLDLPLRGFDEDDVAVLLSGTLSGAPPPALVRRVREITDGNPFFVDGIVRWLAVEGEGAIESGAALPLPEGIRQAIRWRLSVLTPECREALSLASVIGRSFELPTLRKLAGAEGERLGESVDEALRLEILRMSGSAPDEVFFRHGLVRAALYEELPVARRVAIHRRIGEILESRDDTAGRPLAALAHHFFEAAAAGCADKAVEYGLLAGRAAEAELAWEEAARVYAATLAALDLAQVPDEHRRAATLIRLGENQRRVGEREAAARSFLRAVEIARGIGDAGTQARAVLGLGTLSGEGADASGRVDDVLVRHLKEVLASLPPSDSALRARLLGRLAAAIYWVPDSRDERRALSGEAVAIAERIGDRATLAATLSSARHARWGPDDLDERERTARRVLRLAREAGDRERELETVPWRLWDLLERGRVEEARREVAAHERLAERLRQPLHLGTAAMFRALFAMLEGRFGEARDFSARALELGQEAQNPVAPDLFGAQAFVLAWEEGRLADLEGVMSTILLQQVAVPAAQTGVPFVWSEIGRREEARLEFERLAANDFRDLPRDLAWLLGIASLSLTCVRLGDVRRARLLYDLLLPYADRLILVGPPPAATLGPVSWCLGRLAHVIGWLGAAETHFEAALRTAKRLRSPGTRARVVIARAAVRAERGDLVSAGRWLAEGRETARRLGMSALVAEARSLELRAAAAAEPPTDAREGCLLRREGDFWLVVWGGRRARIEDAKGIRYLARLLRHPGEEFHVGELMRILAPEGIRGAFRPGHAGEDLDARAAAEYRRRLQEIEEASIPGAANADALEALRAEAEFIRRELSVARGLGGRRRRSVDDVERIRKTVSRRIRQSAERIARHHPPLGEHLRRSLQTGTFCTYRPREAGAWTVED